MNRQYIKKLSYIFSKPLPFKVLRYFSDENFIFPFYHLVSDTVPLHIKHLYPVVSRQRFLSDLDFLLKHFNPATIDDVLNYVRNGKKSEKPLFFLSFDDGMRECYDIIYPILKQKGIQAAFFINPAFVDNKELFFKHKVSLIVEKLKNTNAHHIFSEISGILNAPNAHPERLTEHIRQLGYANQAEINKIGVICACDFNDYLKKQQPFMTLEQIKELNDLGFHIGSHSFDHPEFRKLDEGQMRLQVAKSMAYLTKNINPGVVTFAFPFTDFEVPGSFFNYMHKEAGIDITFGTAGIKKDPEIKHIQRIPMEEAGMKSAERVIRSEYAYFWMKLLFRKNTITRR